MAKANQEYLKSWDDYQNSKKKRGPIFLPLSIDIDDGVFVRDRIRAPAVKKLYKACRSEVPSYMLKNEPVIPNPETAIKDYLNYFGPIDGVEGPPVETPFDLQICQPTFILFHLPRPNWKFTKDCQYSVANDPDDMGRNFVKICTMDNMNGLLLLNQHRSNPKGLKFNLHVTIKQKIGRKTYETPIIIDPGTGNNGAGIP